MKTKSTGRHQTISESMALALISLYKLTDEQHQRIKILPAKMGVWERLRQRGLVEVTMDGIILTDRGSAFAEGKTKQSKYRRPAKEWGPQIGIRDCLSGRYDYDRLMGGEP